MNWNLKYRSKYWWVVYRDLPTKQREKIEMLARILQSMLKIVLNIGAIFGLVFMVACTVFVIVCAIHGDIKIHVVRDETQNKET